MWPQRLTESSAFFVQKAHSLTSIREPSDVVFWVRCIQDEILTGRRQRAQGNRRTRPLRLAAISQLFNGEEEDLVTVAVLRWSLEEGTTKDELQSQARRHFGTALQQLALAATTTSRLGVRGFPDPSDLACCQHIKPYLPIVEAVKAANCRGGASCNGVGPAAGSRMAIVSPVLPHGLAAYVLERCGLGEAAGMLVNSWEEGIMYTAGPQSASSGGGSSGGGGNAAQWSVQQWQLPDGEGGRSVAHLFTPNLAHAQRMAQELGSSQQASTTSSTAGSSAWASPPALVGKGQDVHASARWRDALERAFPQGAGHCAGEEHSREQLWREHAISLEVHLAEWACPSQPSRAKAIGQQGLHLTDEIALAELAGCLSRAVLDGVAWQ